jgi:hypothetical protein
MRIQLPGLAVVVALATLAGCGDDGAPSSTTLTVTAPAAGTSTTTAATQGSTTPPSQPDGTGPAETATEDPRTNSLETSAANTVRDYIDAINAKDGAAVCAILVPGAIATMDLPVARGSCAASVGASIGFNDPHGIPWKHTQLLKLRKVEVSNGRTATVLASIRTDFADRDEPSFEDDIVFLTRTEDGWLLTKPSASLYRAVGVADVPLAVLSPPD